jgi:hypothetical protein
MVRVVHAIDQLRYFAFVQIIHITQTHKTLDKQICWVIKTQYAHHTSPLDKEPRSLHKRMRPPIMLIVLSHAPQWASIFEACKGS